MEEIIYKKFTAELIGTFVLVLFGTGTAVLGGGTEGVGILGISMAFGLSIIAMAYCIGTVSGCHVNPAVSLAMFINERITLNELIYYIISQVSGAILGTLTLLTLLKTSGLPTDNLGQNGVGLLGAPGAFLVEVILTFVFVLVINPARSISPALFADGEALSSLWIFILAPLVGGALSAVVAKFVLNSEA